MYKLFGGSNMAAGYARFRPPVHPLIIERVRQHFKGEQKFRCALDLGCGAGLSTAALSGLAEKRIGVDPVEAMLPWGRTIAPDARFIAASAEAIPLRDRSVDLVTAAGSLNYTDLPQALKEAARILKPEGLFVVYDFGPGRSFRHTAHLDEWFSKFITRYPWPPDEEQEISPEILQQTTSPFRLQRSERFELELPLRRSFYVEYMLTETNVAFALRNGAKYKEIRRWCEETLRPVWPGEDQEVVFRGYYACLRPV